MAVTYSLNSKGDIISTRIELPEDPFISLDQLTNLPHGNRVFDVFYHLLLAESDRAQHLSLKEPQDYDLLKNGTFRLPDWVTFSDDYALAKDWSDGLRQCNIKGATLRGLLSSLSGILLLGNIKSIEDQHEGCALLGLDPNCLENCKIDDLIQTCYTKSVKNVVEELNKFLALNDIDFVNQDQNSDAEDLNEVIAVVSIVECAPSCKGTILKNVFDNTTGINNELNEDGVPLSKTPAVVTKALANYKPERPMVNYVENFDKLVDEESYLAKKFDKGKKEIQNYDEDGNDEEKENDDDKLCIEDLASSSRIWNVLNVASCSDAESQAKDVWSSQLVSSQIREYFVTEWATKRKVIDFSADFGLEEFLEKYNSIMPPNVGFYELESWARQERNWAPQEFYCGSSRVWVSEDVWRELEISLAEVQDQPMDPFTNNNAAMFNDDMSINNLNNTMGGGSMIGTGGAAAAGGAASLNPPPPPQMPYSVNPSAENVAYPHDNLEQNPFDTQSERLLGAGYNNTHNQQQHYYDSEDDEEEEQIPIDEDYLKKFHGDLEHNTGYKNNVEVVEVDGERKGWVWFVWLLTFWIPSPFLKYMMRMKRREVRMAWREKLVICFLILLLNGAIIFYMIFLGTLICPDYDKVWNSEQVGFHQGADDFYVSIHGKVYDLTKFYKQQHSDISIKTTPDLMLEYAGADLSDFFPMPLTQACPGLVDDKTVKLSINQSKSDVSALSQADHTSGSNSIYVKSKLHDNNWYKKRFEPKIKEYYKGRLVETKNDVKKKAKANENLMWAIIDDEIYDISNYMYTVKDKDPSLDESYKKYNFLDSKVVEMFQNNQGLDITDDFYGTGLDDTTRTNTLQCLKNTFHYGTVDFRNSAKCQAANVILLVLAGILTSVTLIKFLSSLRFGSKKTPSPQDKFVVCQIPAYTEDEDSIRLAVDSLTCLKYENSRKLLLAICDGMIVGSGNDRPTPRIILDLFGVDEKIDPPARPYLAIGEGAQRLNYAKVYSGLYEFEGNVVPYMVVVKVGRPDESRRPGNRGKRDSQIMLMNFFNRIHYQTPMTPLELEMFHQLNNVIGVDPELYEYIFQVDADTSVSNDALTRLVAQCTNDAKVAGTCGETSLQNEEQSWATMIQVYEYFISHHLTKAFESLFGTVTCLPGCFSLYRMRTAKKHRPLIISNDVIREYGICNVDTLHKKNLFTLGEDRYLTTLITKYFPRMKLTFVADAHAQTVVPDEFKVLLSQRRRWINSTVHNLVELLRINDMCGFCCFGMRGIVFIDLVGTMMLPSVVVYLSYLIYKIAAHDGALPLISIILIAAVYGLQMLVFILKRQWQHIGWMIIYLLAYPIHSFLLPIYSFWNMDNFSWGNTRVVVGEKNGKQVVSVEDQGFDPSTVPLETWKAYAVRNGYKGAERPIIFDDRKGRLQNQVYEDEYGYDMQELEPVDHRKTIYDVDQQSRLEHGGAASVYSSGTRPMSTFSENPFGNNRNTLSQFGSLPASQSRMSLATSTRMSAMGPATVMDVPPPLPEIFDEQRDAQISDTIHQVLENADLDNMTKRQLREKVEDMLGVQFQGDKIAHVDQLIDEELERLDEEDESDGDQGKVEEEMKHWEP